MPTHKGLTEADLYEYTQMCVGKYGPQWTAIRKLVNEVRQLRQDLRATKPAGTIRNQDLDAVLLASAELHKSLTTLIPKLRPVPIADDGISETQPTQSLDQNASNQVRIGTPEIQPPAGPSKLLLSVPEMCAILGISRTSAWQLVNEGKIASIRVGRRRLIPQTAIRDFVGAQR